MKKIIFTVVITVAVMALGSWLYIISGSFNVSQLVPHNGFTQWVINTTRRHSIKSRIGNIQVPNLNDSAMIAIGFVHYNEMCAGCHGAPGEDQWEMVEGLYPKPPKIYKFAKKLKPASTFWVIKNGIKMTSMPGFGPTHSDYKIWSMTAFLTKKLGYMSPAEYRQWAQKYR